MSNNTILEATGLITDFSKQVDSQTGVLIKSLQDCGKEVTETYVMSLLNTRVIPYYFRPRQKLD